jgi:hypothetical protein
MMSLPDKRKMRLVRETRWHREYALEEPDHYFVESKFADGSAYVTLEDLAREWPAWSDWERTDFCQEVGHATFPHLPDILRFVMRNGDLKTWSGLALNLVHHLPADEVIPFLIEVCTQCPAGEGTNLLQALARSGAPEAHEILRSHLDRLWADERVFREEKFFNSFAADTTFCLQHLLELGENSPDLAEKYQALLKHPNESNRRSARHFLSKYFPGVDFGVCS